MNNQIRSLLLILIMAGCAFGPAFSNDGFQSQRYLAGATSEEPEFTTRQDEERPSRCTRLALAALKSIPMLRYKCGAENVAELMDSARRRAAIRTYSRKLELTVSASWWKASAYDLTGCAFTHKARALTDKDRDSTLPHPRAVGLLDFHTRILGDASTRLLVVTDRCISDSYRNVFLLQRAHGRTYATPVIELEENDWVEFQNDEDLVMIATHHYVAFSTWEGIDTVFSIDPSTHHAVPKNFFMDKGKLTNELRYDEGLSDDLEEDQWHATPLIYKHGGIAPQFEVDTPIPDKERGADTSRRFSHKTYVWNGQYYVAQ
jgi:hypothetical protein